MKRFILGIGIAILSFTVGAITTRLWDSYRSRTQTSTITIIQTGKERPLTKENVSQALQSRAFRTDKLRKNSRDEIVWRWLKEAIVAYPQKWLKLEISDSETYAVVLEAPVVLNAAELDYLNQELRKQGLPALVKDKRYLPIEVLKGNIVCPNWFGYIDVEETKLVYFVGTSG